MRTLASAAHMLSFSFDRLFKSPSWRKVFLFLPNLGWLITRLSFSWKLKLEELAWHYETARFSNAPETSRAVKAIFSPFVSENGEVYSPETSCVKRTSLHIKNMWIKQLCNHKVRHFAMAFRARKVLAFEKRAPGATLRDLTCLRNERVWPNVT